MREFLIHLASLLREKETKDVQISQEAWLGLLQSFREVNHRKNIKTSDGYTDPALIIGLIKRGIKNGEIEGFWKELTKPDEKKIDIDPNGKNIKISLDITWRRFEEGMEAYQQWLWGCLGLSFLGYGMVSTVETTNITEMMERAGKRITLLITEIYDAYRAL